MLRSPGTPVSPVSSVPYMMIGTKAAQHNSKNGDAPVRDYRTLRTHGLPIQAKHCEARPMSGWESSLAGLVPLALELHFARAAHHVD
jgi:hypothetical protein